jgi:hypothetical protein
LETLGPDGCDSASIVGFGEITTYATPVVTDPIHAEVTAFNGENGGLLLFVFPDLGPTFVIEGLMTGETTVSFDIPEILTLPSAPPAAIGDFTLTLGQSQSGAVVSDLVTNTWIAAPAAGGITGGGDVSGGGAAKPVTPRISLGGSRTQRFKGSVTVNAGCHVPCTLSASATVSVAGQSRVHRSRPATRKIAAAGLRRSFRLKFRKNSSRSIRRALARGKPLKARIRLVARGVGVAASKRSSRSRAVKLTR